MQEKICLITFSNNADHQNVVYSMFNALNGKAEVYTIGIINPKSSIAAKTERNFYVNCPTRPGIGKGTFQFGVLFDIARTIREHNIRYLYFESQHIWNAFLMLLCPQCIKVVAIHDVIPHDGNKAMMLSNYVTSHMADHMVLRNYKYKSLLASKYHIKEDKITCMEPWRDYPPETPCAHSGIFLCFGRIRLYKGMEQLFEIIRLTPDIHYRVVGEPDNESRIILNQLSQMHNVDLIDREVTDEEMAEEFKNADWIILPYAAATQSGVIADACRFSRPVISFNVGAICEQVEDGRTGFLVEECNVDEFVLTVSKARALPADDLENYCHSAYEYGYSKYAASSAASRFIEVLKNIGEVTSIG
ncbi:MAG: glycosyltransferase family 4 protein [Aminipila sp.]